MSFYPYEFEDTRTDLDHASNHLEGVLEVLYDGNKSLQDLEFHLEEMCASLGVPFSQTKKLKIQKKENEYFEIGKTLIESMVKTP